MCKFVQLLLQAMNKTTKIILLGTGIIGGLVLAISKYRSLQNMYKLLIITPRIAGGLKNIKISLTGITIPIEIDFSNRSDQTLSVQVNAIDVYYKNNILSQSKPTSSEVAILPNAVSTLKNINLFLPISSLISSIGNIIQSILAQGSLSTKFAQLVNSFELDCTCTYNKSFVYSFKTSFGASTQLSSNSSQKTLGLTAASNRTILPMSDYINYIPSKSELNNNDLVLIKDGNVEDTVYCMHDLAHKYQNDTVMLSKLLQGRDIKQTVSNLFYFVYNYIQYVPDSPVLEQVRRPLRTLWDRKGDCDCFSVLIASMCNNLNIPYKFRIAAYGGRSNYQHVYVVIETSQGDLICDPVVDKPFYEKQPSKYKDFPKK